MSADKGIVLSVHNIKKKIANKWIIKDISFDLREGEIFGFLGPNGSGKTTTIRMMVDLIRPSEGRITICGYDVQKHHNEALQHVGSIVENPELYSFLSGWENLEHFARMIPGIGEERIREVVEIVGLEARIHDKVKTYSLGMRQRLGIAQALLGKPKLLILDEPTNGLDPQGIKEMREFIRALAQMGLTLFVSSHLLSEIQQMCDRVAIISQGKVIYVGEVQKLLQQAGNTVIWKLAPFEQGMQVLKEMEAVQVIRSETMENVEHSLGLGSVVTQMEEEQIAHANAALVRSGVQVFSIDHRMPTLEELFLHMTEGERIE